MAYVPIPYPSVLYSATGVPQPVATAAVAATMPVSYTAAPTVAAPVVVPTVDPIVVISTADAMASNAILSLAAIVAPAAVPMVLEVGGPVVPFLNG